MLLCLVLSPVAVAQSDAHGFILYDTTGQVVGYSERGGDVMPQTLQNLVRQRQLQIVHLNESALRQRVRHLVSDVDTRAPHTVGTMSESCAAVPPLLDGWTRHQKHPYNAYCPHYDDSVEPCVVGCVATAMESIISYYGPRITLREPIKGREDPHYTVPDVAAGEQVDASIIRSEYDGDYTSDEAEAVARLSLWLGMAAEMNWGLDASGAMISKLVEPLRNAFGFGYVHHIDSYYYTPQTWRQIIEDELRGGRPILYTGDVMALGGHAFVLDGLDEAGFVHVNWGYGGMYDGYFMLDVLNFNVPTYDTQPDDYTQGYFANNEALLFHPQAQETAPPQPLERTGYEVQVLSVEPKMDIMVGKYTPIEVTLRNTADVPLKTPFLLFTNSPDDEDYLELGESVCMFGATLQPGEEQTITVAAKFRSTGNRIIRITTDGEAIIFEQPAKVLPYITDNVALGTISYSFDAAGEVTFSVPYTNTSDARSGAQVTYCLCQGDAIPTDGEPRHTRYVYVSAGESITDRVTFRGLTPEATYTLLVRYNWEPRATMTITLPPAPEGLEHISATTESVPAYGLDGRRAVRANLPSVVISRNRKQIQPR